MKNWALLAVAVVASGSMVIGSAACTVGSDTGEAAGSGGSAGTASGGSAGSVAAGAGGSVAGAAGSGGTVAGNVVTDFFSDPSAKDCAACLNTMTGKLSTEATVDCGAVVTKCGTNGCDDTMTCIEKQITDKGYELSYDCAVSDCMGVISTNSDGEDFINCVADKCGAKCGFTVGFGTTVCKLPNWFRLARKALVWAPFAFLWRWRRDITDGRPLVLGDALDEGLRVDVSGGRRHRGGVLGGRV